MDAKQADPWAVTGSPGGRLHREDGHPGQPADILPVSGVSANGLLISGRVILMGYKLFNTNAGPQVLQLLDGIDANGTLIVYTRPASQASDQGWFGPNGISCDQGLFLTVAGGPINGSVWVVQKDKSADPPPHR